MKWVACASLLILGCNDGRNDNNSGTTGGKHDMAISNNMFDLAEPPLNTNDGGGGGTDDAGTTTHDPVTCDEAAMSKSYIGCDYWPTVNFNAVWSVFDFAVVISNPGMTDAHITITGGSLPSPSPTPAPTTVPPGQLVKIGLPWVVPLKGPDTDSMGSVPMETNSVLAVKGAYHLVSDTPVLVYQFNALEYTKGTGNDLNGKPWSSCPAAAGLTCNSYTNDASLLLPSTAMTGNYVITGVHGDDLKQGSMTMGIDGPHVAITAVMDGTMVTVKLGASASTLASADGKVPAGAAGSKNTYTLNAGDVLELLAAQTGTKSDLTGSQIQSNNPVQVISGAVGISNPQVNPVQLGFAQYTFDHVEETQLPYETWGKNYVVASVTGPNGNAVAQTVRIYGGATAANLTYSATVAGAPTMVAAYGVAEFDASTSFVVTGDNVFQVGVIQKSGEIVDTVNKTNPSGDPSLSFISAVEQYRDRYIFLAPSDYDSNYADVVIPNGTALTLDGAAVTQTATSIGGGYGVIRIKLSLGSSGGAHVLTGSAPFGLQVEGYGAQTSYQYPAGLDLKVITQPPPPIS